MMNKTTPVTTADAAARSGWIVAKVATMADGSRPLLLAVAAWGRAMLGPFASAWMTRLLPLFISTFPFFMVGCASQTEEISTEEISKPFLMLNSETYQDQYGQPWPLEVESGKLYCVGYKISPDVVFETKGRVYAVNGNAASKMDGPSLWIGKTEIKSLKYGKINEIRKTNPKGAMYGLMSVSAMIREGINLCAEN